MKQNKFVLDQNLANRYGMNVADLRLLCLRGQFLGARFNRRSCSWFIPVPVVFRSRG